MTVNVAFMIECQTMWMTLRTFFTLLCLTLLSACAPRVSAAPAGTPDASLVRSRIKHIFVIYQENHTFDNYFGTYPGAENLSTALAKAHGYSQYDPIGKQWVTPFRITDPDTSGPSQSREVIEAKMDGNAMDRFVAAQEQASSKLGPAGAESVGLITMAHYDCDTLPYLWKYAKTFTLFDHYFQALAGPSTPNNVEIIAAQDGQSQAARFPADRAPNPKAPGDPIYGDADPQFGPYESGKAPKEKQIDQRYATLMLALGGKSDSAATADAAGVREDLATVSHSGAAAVPWGWYQEGYNGPDVPADFGYVTHHNGPQYFGYLRNNAVFWKNEHPLKLILNQLQSGSLPSRGIFYIKGGGHNSFGWKPVDADPVVQAQTYGDDDHPGVDESDHEVGEAFVATFVNAIARSKYWKDSAIIITWDDAGGYYDHVPPPNFERCSDGHPCGDGPRVPMMIISPFAKSGAIVHDAGDTASVVKFAESVFGTTPLGSLPDERPVEPEGPRDTNPAITNLFGAFDPERLTGSRAPIPASAAEIPDATVNRIPTTMNCASLGIAPVAIPNENTSPKGFTPRSMEKP